MTIHKLDRTEWGGFCDRVSKGLMGKRAEISSASLSIGSQLESKGLLVLGIAYDRHNDLIEIVLDGLDHMIRRPREFYVDYGPGGVSSFGVIDDDDAWQIVILRDPLMLSPFDEKPGAEKLYALDADQGEYAVRADNSAVRADDAVNRPAGISPD